MAVTEDRVISGLETLRTQAPSGLADRVNYWQIQFHRCVPDHEKRYLKIREGLLKTHKPTFQENWCWEGFELR